MNIEDNMSIKKIILLVVIFIILMVPFGIYLGIKNTSDYGAKQLILSDVSNDVKVYRDDKGIPTIIASNDKDLYFVQGYEMARDRLWQLEFLRSVGYGELSQLISPSLLNVDKYLRNLGLIDAAENSFNRLSDSNKEILHYFVSGINKYIELHRQNLPLEFYVLNSDAKLWDDMDPLVIQGVMSRTLSLGAMNRELFREKLAILLGKEKAQELYPIEYTPARDFFLSLNFTSSSSVVEKMSFYDQPGFKLLDKQLSDINFGFSVGSNNWVVSGNITDTGNPLLNNDPHLSLDTPSIWWQVQLVSPTTHLQGFTLAGVPGIIIGHNDYIAWGVTNTGTDALDLYYVKTNDKNQYYYNNTWRDFIEDKQIIKDHDGNEHEFIIKKTDFGIVLDPETFGFNNSRTLVMRWTLHESIERNNLMRAIINLNRAKSVYDAHDALKYWSVPGQNFVLADIDGNIAYQYTGLTPIRRNGTYGVVPLNASDNRYGWDGFIDYDDQYYVVNPSSNYFYTANDQIDPRNQFYITDMYAMGYRGMRINDILSNTQRPLNMSVMEDLQSDSKSLYAEVLLDPYKEYLQNYEFTDADGNIKELNKARDYLLNWDYYMQRESVGASIFATTRIYFETYTVKDELDKVDTTLYQAYAMSSPRLMRQIAANYSSTWFDNITTTNKIETGKDIFIHAFKSAVSYLDQNIGFTVASWKWKKVHFVQFSHVLGSAIKYFNEGNVPADGSSFTVLASGGSPRWVNGSIEYSMHSGPSLRFITEVSSSWSNSEGILVPGSSGHLFNKHRNDGVMDWVNNIYHPWEYVTSIGDNPTFIYIHG